MDYYLQFLVWQQQQKLKGKDIVTQFAVTNEKLGYQDAIIVSFCLN